MSLRQRLQRAADHARQRTIDSALIRLPARVAKPPAVSGPPTYEVVHGQPVGVGGYWGLIALAAEPTACAAAFSGYDIDDVVADGTELPEGFGVLRDLTGAYQWACNWNDSWGEAVLIRGDFCLSLSSLRLPITGTSPVEYIDFLLPWSFGQR